eukprot:1661258-Rhodomonas_salina.3
MGSKIIGLVLVVGFGHSLGGSALAVARDVVIAVPRRITPWSHQMHSQCRQSTPGIFRRAGMLIY